MAVNQRTFGKTSWRVSEIGLGTWQLGPDWGGVDDGRAQSILQSAADRGINFFDTADVYGAGLSEQRIGAFRKKQPRGLYVATKIGRFPDPGFPANYALKYFREHAEACLTRLGMEALDLIQMHSLPTDYVRGGDWVEWFEILKKEGKIRHYGVSVETVEEALMCLDVDGLTSLQIIFNMFRQKPIEELFDKAKKKKVALIVRLPLASGLLSGKFTAATRFQPQDHRSYNRDGQAFNVGETFAGLPFEKGVELAAGLKAMVPAGMTMAQMALRWILDFDAVSVVIPGATTVDQVIQNVSASGLPRLSDQLHRNLRDYYLANVFRHIRGKY